MAVYEPDVNLFLKVDDIFPATEIDITSNSEKTGLNDSQFLKAGILCNSPIISINTHTTTQIIPKILDSSANLF